MDPVQTYILQAKLNSMMEKSNSDNPRKLNGKLIRNLYLTEVMKNTICKNKKQKKKRKIGIHNGL